MMWWWMETPVLVFVCFATIRLTLSCMCEKKSNGSCACFWVWESIKNHSQRRMFVMKTNFVTYTANYVDVQSANEGYSLLNYLSCVKCVLANEMCVLCISLPRSLTFRPTNMIYVKKWMRTKHALLFRLSNRTIQVRKSNTHKLAM